MPAKSARAVEGNAKEVLGALVEGAEKLLAAANQDGAKVMEQDTIKIVLPAYFSTVQIRSLTAIGDTADVPLFLRE